MTQANSRESVLREALSAPSEVEQFAAMAGPIWPAYLIAASICVGLAWGTLPHTYLASWGVVYGTFMVTRGLMFRHYNALTHAERIENEPAWRRRFTVVMFCYGTLQSLLIAVSIPWLPLGTNFLMTWLIFFSSVLVTTVMPLSEISLRIYIGITLLPTAVSWLFVEMDFNWLISIGLVAASVVFLKGGKARLASLGQTYRLATQLAESNALLKRANESRTRMIMEASHDLRQPAHALGMMVERLQYATPGPDFLRRVGQIEEGIVSLSDMLNELMEFSRLDLGEYVPHVEPVNLATVLEEVDQRFAVVAQTKGLAWSVQRADVWVDSDPWLLRRIINNVVTNAIKYTARGGISIGCNTHGDQVALFVEDTGPGIAQEHQARVFMEYVRLNNAETDEPGMGIGLAFARRAADAMGHALRLHSEFGVGTRMTLMLLMREPPEASSPDAPSTSGVLTQLLAGSRVMLLENDPMLRNSMLEVIAGWDAHIEAFAGSDELAAALKSGAAGQPDVVVADLHLDGGLSGLEVVQQIRAHFPRAHIPAILLTGDLSRGVEEHALALNTRVAYKPLRPGRLKALMAEEIGKTFGTDEAGRLGDL